MESTTSKAIDKAVKKVEELSLDREARIEYEFREKALKDYNSIIFDAKEEGIKKGIKEGEIKGKIEAVIKLITKYKVDIDTAMKDFDLPFEYKKQIEERLIGI